MLNYYGIITYQVDLVIDLAYNTQSFLTKIQRGGKMGFSSDFAERVGFRAGYKCEVCSADLRRKKEGDVARHVAHSASSFHLTGGPQFYIVGDPPDDLKRHKGKLWPGNMFLVSIYKLADDAFCVCPTCHRDIHAEALRETKRQFKSHKGRNAHWAILERVTLNKVFGIKDPE